MTNPFSSYRVINATSIVKSNIRPDYIKEDISGLLHCLIPLKYLTNPNTEEGLSLSQTIVNKLHKKSNTLDLLIYFGYVRKNNGEYVYQSARTSQERERRKNGVIEFQKFFTDLKKAENGALKGFEAFLRIKNPVPYSSSNDESEVDEDLLPTSLDVKNSNIKTLTLIRSLKESLVTEYNTSPSHSFIRRKLAHVLLKQKNRELRPTDDDLIDQTIDQNIYSLKQKDRQTNVPRTDHVYIECLIRTNFNEKQALQILQHNRPNLEPPPQPVVSTTSNKTSISNLVEPLKQHGHGMNQHKNENIFTRQLSRPDDKWENVKHIIPSIQKLRQASTDTNADDVIFSKMYRLLFSELLPIIGSQLTVKIEMFARMLCDLPLERIENLDIITIKNILSLHGASQIHENFEKYAMGILSSACPICLSSFPRNQMESMFLCDHSCCLPCLKDYYRTNIDRIQDANSLTILTCFQEPHEITSDVHHNFFTYLEAKLNQWFPDQPELLRKYHDKIFNATSGKEIKKCGNPQCISSFYVDENIRNARVRCPHCQFAQCGQCFRKWYQEHTDMECDEYMDWLINNDPEDPDVQALKYLRTDGIVCPNENCQEVYQFKAGGCEHFTCEKCKTDFCRMCSTLFFSLKKNLDCPFPKCLLKNSLHAHCPPNCFRETRIGTTEAIIQLLVNNDIDVEEELQQKPVSTNEKCPVEDCGKPILAASGNRLCEVCYRQFLCSLIWNHQLEPWEVYEDNNLQQMLVKASVPIPEIVAREDLIALCQEHLNATLGEPKKLTKSILHNAND